MKNPTCAIKLLRCDLIFYIFGTLIEDEFDSYI